MKKLILISILFLGNFAYCQDYPKVIVVDGDTVFVFLKEQAKKMTTWDVEKNSCLELLSNCDSHISTLDSLLSLKEQGLIVYKQKDIVYQSTLKTLKELNYMFSEENLLLEKQVKKEKRKGLFNTVIGVVITFLVTFLFSK